MTLGYIYKIYFAVLTAESTASVDPTAIATEAQDTLSDAAGMLRRTQSPAKEADVEPESLLENGAGSEWTSMDHVPISKYFSFAEYGQRYREATGIVQRKTPADTLSSAHQKELRFFVRSLLEEAEDFEAMKILEHTKQQQSPPGATKVNHNQAPAWFHGGQNTHPHAMKFQYQCSSIGRDGFECNPTEPVSEYFGPFVINYGDHSVRLRNWNLKLGTKLQRYGMGNLIVGNNHTYSDARNGVIVGNSNVLKGSYGFVAGRYNLAKGRGPAVTGGDENYAMTDFTNVNGGQLNKATIHFAVVSGGFKNQATAPFSTVGGGENNLADGFSATVMGGRNNEALANLSAVLGGHENEIPALAISETVQGGNAHNVPTPEPPKALVLEPGEYVSQKAKSNQELNYAALGCVDETQCEQEEEEEGEEEAEEHDNPATQRRTIEIEAVEENGDSRRRTVHADSDEDLQIMAPPDSS